MNKFSQLICVLVFLLMFSACGKLNDNTSAANMSPAESVNSVNTNQPNPVPANVATPVPTPESTTNSPIGKFDFKNYTYPLPRGWQDQDGEVTLENGKSPVVMSEEEKKIGARFVGTKYGDVTSDGQDEAFVVIKIETGGSAIPQMVYVFEWKNNAPELIWAFRTGDRADGGLKDLRAENGEFIIELFGQDRYIFGDVETMKVTGDEENLCCPTYFTRNRYKLTGTRFVLQGKRETFSVADPNAPPVENMGDKKAEATKKK
ncbi:MAG TPA: hypothetical protein PKY82_09185 [Pyrinomonadaceae bacterium]|nr:hypothetical protein [Pyrinomonadaceae bacterium]